MCLTGCRKYQGKITPLLLACLSTIPVLALGTPSPATETGSPSYDVADYVLQAVADYPIVCLAEGQHATEQPHEVHRRLLADDRIIRAVDVLIVEFANAAQQEVLDEYIRGGEVPLDRLSRIWRDTTLSPNSPWDSPVYQKLLAVVRQANQSVEPEHRLRVLAGDPPIDWQAIQTPEDYRAARRSRGEYVGQLARRQAFDHGLRVLIIFGGAHLSRVPVGDENDGRNSFISGVLAERPDAVKAISFFWPQAMGAGERVAELEFGRLYETERHWCGDTPGESVFPGTFSRVTDPRTGEVSWQQVPLYTGYRLADLFDALIYYGDESEWEYSPPEFDEERDAEYLVELERRKKIRFGGN